MLKKLTSVALSALLALSAIAPIGAVAGNATLPAVDVAAPLDGFDSAELSAYVIEPKLAEKPEKTRKRLTREAL